MNSTPTAEESRSRTARVSRDAAGDPIGAALFLTADELENLGVDLSGTDSVDVRVEDGELTLSPEGDTEDSA